MSFISVPALDRLLEPSEHSSSWSSQPSSAGGMDSRGSSSAAAAAAKERERAAFSFPSHTTPSLDSRTPAAASPSYSFSPYVLNFKRRDGKSLVQDPPPNSSDSSRERSADAAAAAVAPPPAAATPPAAAVAAEAPNSEWLRMLSNGGMRLVNRNMEQPSCENRERSAGHRGEEWGWPSGSSKKMEDFSSRSSMTDEFFDAGDAALSEAGYSSGEESLQLERRTEWLNSTMRGHAEANVAEQLDEEIRRRIAAEDAMALLQQQNRELASQLAMLDSVVVDVVDPVSNEQEDDAAQAQKLAVAHVVASSIARGAARAEAKEELENVVADKNRELARLRDKLQYYELVNHEMSHHNQEAIESARRQRQMQKQRQHVLVVCIGAAACLGVSAALIYKWFPWTGLQWQAAPVLLEDHLHPEFEANLSSQPGSADHIILN
jgi:hypothetical protein